MIDPETFRAVMRVLAHQPKRKRFQKTCPICGKEFPGTARAVYCSARCSQRAYRARKRGQG